MRIASIGRALPEHYYDQATLRTALERQWAPRLHNPARFGQIHRNACIDGRHLVLPIDAYERIDHFGAANDEWIRCGLDLGERAVRTALEGAGLRVTDVDQIFSVSVTGIATPSLDARLANRMKMRADLKRTPIFGLGCVGGVAGLARAADYLRGFPDDVAVLLSVELCSLTLQRGDLSIGNLIASGLFGDGAAAAVMTGAKRGGTGPRVVDSRSLLLPDSEHLIGWEIGSSGFRIVISGELPNAARGLRKHVDEFLAAHELTLSDLHRFLVHPGGPRVLEAFEESLELPEDALRPSWESLRRVGNLSSASILLILEDVMAQPPPRGSHGLLIGLGPGLHCELVLLQW